VDLLKRELAPILPEAWALIDAEATRVLHLNLAGRRLVDLCGPHGWRFGAVDSGRLDLLPEQPDRDLNLGLRKVQPLMEVRVPIKLSLMELDTAARGALQIDLQNVVTAAEKIALLEDRAIFSGFAPAGITGLMGASPHKAEPVPVDLKALPEAVLRAKETLRQAGVNGPYALVLGTRLYDRVVATSEDGHPLTRRIEGLIVDRPIVRAPSIDDGLVISLRGGDYELWLGQDLSIGYAHHEKHEVELYLTESFTFRILEANAAVVLSARPRS
jgi:uncharacterized linocin/CFP29 family protein